MLVHQGSPCQETCHQWTFCASEQYVLVSNKAAPRYRLQVSPEVQIWLLVLHAGGWLGSAICSNQVLEVVPAAAATCHWGRLHERLKCIAHIPTRVESLHIAVFFGGVLFYPFRTLKLLKKGHLQKT